MSKRVAVLMGGPSAEREVSLVSGRECAAGLRKAGYKVSEIDVGHDLAALLEALSPRPDAVFNALHGRWGEDGCVQGVLNLIQLPYTHSGLLASAVAMDKPMAKQLFAAAGLACPEGVIVHRDEVLAGDVMARPYVIKPPNEGSSVGVRIVTEGANEPPLSGTTWQFGEMVMVERYVAGRELTVAVMGDRPLAVTEIRPQEGFYDYEAKYTEEHAARHVVPAKVPKKIADKAMDMALRAHQVLGCRGISRADFRYDDTRSKPGELFLLEVNTQPGMTPLSLVPEQAAHQGISFAELCAWLVENAACDA
ncbi:MAG: D-alanine--D-alanine ligase [Rhodospirillales bacterium]|nr:D-alanine--D-alanine ligase [Rhodospirillales bacterium]MDH3911776.1 D-alanine--D-alanine ligase [Rhodospirillales bacterium]MDH3916646.1 D-alanine--D-alanine ligase [Rhodospirillales bacterium]MDH3966852.1 D-alanine--D-alanine ligase [Rhodospirillales bacterium]